jgi:hypothetical protein
MRSDSSARRVGRSNRRLREGCEKQLRNFRSRAKLLATTPARSLLA